MADIKEITEERFKSLFFSFFHPLSFLAKGLSWYELLDGKLLGMIAQDTIDYDYFFCILGRDSKNLFRCIYNEHEFATPYEAFTRMVEKMEDYRNDGKTNYPQGDEKQTPNKIFEPQIPEEKFHPIFKRLWKEERFMAARKLISEIAYAHTDVDGHYIKEFQGDGFEARLWELYLYRYFYETGFLLDTAHPAPDYFLSKFDENIAVEAVTIGATTPEKLDEILEKGEDELINNYMPIKYGSPLYSKLCHKYKGKHYWELDHVSGNPFIIAIHDYHFPATFNHPGSMTYSAKALLQYLYGCCPQTNGVDVTWNKIEEHIWEEKRIPSGFFFQPETENVSAILFANQATLSKFSRMAILAGIKGCPQIIQIERKRLINNHLVITSELVSDQDYEETWSDGNIMFHNPRALHPVNSQLFSNISHIFYDEDNDCPEFHLKPDHIFSTNVFDIKLF